MDLSGLIANEAADRPLGASFYMSPEIFSHEVMGVIGEQWLLAGHVSMIPRAGDYFLFDVGGESLIVTRQRDGSAAAFFNVCRHRGSRICREPAGRAKTFVCSYHAWSYNLDGSLLKAPYMPADFDPADVRLERAGVEVLEGLIFVTISGRSPAVRAAARGHGALSGAERHRLGQARRAP